MPESRWQRRFEDSIVLPDGKSLDTLRDAADYITGPAERAVGRGALANCYRGLDTGGTNRTDNVARIAFMKALNRNVALAFT
jgi:hypothetical protein